MAITRYSQIVMPQDANVVGTLFGGQMVSWMDIAAAKSAHRFIKGTPANITVTRAIDAIEFKQPVHIGDWVNFTSKVTKTGNTSIVIKVEAYKECKESDQVLACTGIFTMVSVKKDGDGTYHKIAHGKSL